MNEKLEKENNEKIQILVSTQNLLNDFQVSKLIKNMNIKSNYLIVNQTNKNEIKIKNSKVITKNEKGLSKSRNLAILKAEEEIVVLADDDVRYIEDYEKIIIESYKKYKNVDIICFFVESMNTKRKTKRMLTGKIGYIRANRIASFEITFRKKSITKNKIKFNEKFGAGAELNRGEEQLFLYEAIKNKLKIIFINKKIANVKQDSSTWFNKKDEDFFIIQGKVFKEMSRKFYIILCMQYAIRKYFSYRKNIGFFKALKCMLMSQ